MKMPNVDPNCNFCLDNDTLRGLVVARTALAYLMSMDPPRDGAHLIVPTDHAVELRDLPEGFMGSVAELVEQVPGLGDDYNLSLNHGRQAGQTMEHLHFWVVQRPADKPSSGIGLYGLMKRVDAAGQ